MAHGAAARAARDRSASARTGIGGDARPILTASGTRLPTANAIPGTTALIESAAHLPNLEQPDAFNHALRALLARVAAKAKDRQPSPTSRRL
ncbi:hypothetical protein ACFYMW_01890 [Streptomyces sp. NPDC006692]|uniref:hypothetical protein n=1 Tax=unclassified Streptomyces TaxID=2593676 RepID=UPI0036CCC19D